MSAATAATIELDRPVDQPPADPPPRAPGAVLSAAGSLGVSQAVGRGEHPRGSGAARICDGRSLSRIEQNQRLDDLLKELQIEHIRSNTAISLSGGERRRVEIARALATSPRFILLDEPFAGVDPIAVIEIQRIVTLLRNRRIGVLITDHNVRETLGICDRAYIMNDGIVLASGRPQEIVHDERVRKAYLGEEFRM